MTIRSLHFFEEKGALGPHGEEERRLVLASFPVFLFGSMLYVAIVSPDLSSFLLPAEAARMERKAAEERVYPYLMEQERVVQKKSDQISALSSVDAEGTGGITKSHGFHTLSADDELHLGRSGQKTAATKAAKTAESHSGAGYSVSPDRTSQAVGSDSPIHGEEAQFKIPANYRFQNDFSLRYNGDSVFSIARRELAGYQFFKRMLRHIRENFSPPGLNYAYRDAAGLVVNQPIKPQVVRVQFLLDPNGIVRDVRVVSSLGQKPVDQACIDVLMNQNFGPPPPEIFKDGNIFGINFVFPRIR